jgi:hypothetical protein
MSVDTTAHQEYPASFSTVDKLFARATTKTSNEYGKDPDETDMDIDLSEIVRSVEVPAAFDSIETKREDAAIDNLFGDSPMNSDQEARLERSIYSQPNETLDIRGKYEAQVDTFQDLVRFGWSHQDTILAYLKVDRAGFEPLFPLSWRHDFPLFPRILFTDDAHNAFISSMRDKESIAIHFFDRLCQLGLRVRDLELHGFTNPMGRPEVRLRKSINEYIRWAWRDADLENDIRKGRVPPLVIVTGGRGLRSVAIDDLTRKLESSLRDHGRSLCASLESPGPLGPKYLMEPPTVFGFVVTNSFVGVLAWEPISEEARSFGFYNFMEKKMESMHAISLAIIIHWARHSMVRIKRALEEQRGTDGDDSDSMDLDDEAETV